MHNIPPNIEDTYIPHRQRESVKKRLEYCRAMLYTSGIIGDTTNDKIKRKIKTIARKQNR